MAVKFDGDTIYPVKPCFGIACKHPRLGTLDVHFEKGAPIMGGLVQQHTDGHCRKYS